ncbi:related to ornithine transporter 2 [Cephalotrichum gorgonifer]|uniref:Related to ornithine transporter 2 n=1 Tax=Cephalotrichum gorgonifer TaxID=2041049 RepID=A0AAE8SXR1_9PEZI|nr:related to ornithine transporter 2 [Cephalotrichum gorgonifer]
MSADFWAGYVSGAIGILIGNPLDLIKVRLQASTDNIALQGASSYARQFQSTSSLVTGTAAPILGYGALNALLFVSYNRAEAALNNAFSVQRNLWSTWAAGAAGGLATWVVSTPTELIKCRAQMASPPRSSWSITKKTLRTEGVRGLYFGGAVTALRDSVGYGFYFWTYELCNSWVDTYIQGDASFAKDASKVLLSGGLAGVATWASIFPLDVIKTRVQTQPFAAQTPLIDSTGLASSSQTQLPPSDRRLGAIQVAKLAYQEGGMGVFFRGLTICSIRAFMVNAVQWAVYEWMMHELGHGRKQRNQSTID